MTQPPSPSALMALATGYQRSKVLFAFIRLNVPTLDLSTHRQLLDLGGGTGAMSIALCRSFPALRAIVLDLPPVAAVARESVRESGLTDRIEVREGDLVAEPLPGGCDIVLLAN